MTRVLTGDVRLGEDGGDLVVVATRRGRRGEDRTMVELGRLGRDGLVETVETRSYAAVQTCPRLGRVRLSLAPGGAHYCAPWRGRAPAIHRN